MTTSQILAVGLVHVCIPGPQTGWPNSVQVLLDQRDAAALTEAAADYGTVAWLRAQAARIAAEVRLALLLNVPATRPVLDTDALDWLEWATTPATT